MTTRLMRVGVALIGLLGPLTLATSTRAAARPQPAGHSLTVLETGSGSGTVTSADGAIACPPGCNHFYTSSAPVTITATPASGSTFTGWSASCSGTAPSCTVSMTSDQTVTATFTKTSSAPPPPPPPPTCTLHVPSPRVRLTAPRSQPARHSRVGRLALKVDCDQSVQAKLTVRVVEDVPGAHPRMLTFRLTRRFALAAGHPATVTFKLWPGALRGLKHHRRETLIATLRATNQNGGAGGSITRSLKGVG